MKGYVESKYKKKYGILVRNILEMMCSDTHIVQVFLVDARHHEHQIVDSFCIEA